MNERQRTKGYVSYEGGRVFRGKTLYSFRLKDEERWYNCGEADPKVKKGDLVEFDYEETNGGYKVFVDSITLTSPGASTAPKAAGGAERSGAKNDGYWNERLSRDIANDEYRKANDIRIQWQSARNAAIELVAILVQKEALIIPEKKGAAEQVIRAKIKDLTFEFFKECEQAAPSNTPVEEARDAA